MLGNTHERVAARALDRLPMWLQEVLRPQWDWLQGGATLTDFARTFWEPADSVGEGKRALVHRYYLDSPHARDRGVISQIINYAFGTISYIQEEGENPLTEAERGLFHGQVALQFGIISHHIADLCTPVHLGDTLNAHLERLTSRGSFHSYYERALERYSRQARLDIDREAREIPLEPQTFESIARRIYEEVYLQLPSLYADESQNLERIQALARWCFATAVDTTSDVWYTIATQTRAALT
jgi:hypothetical protein